MKCRLVVFLAVASIILADASLWAQRRGPRRGEQSAARFGWISSLEAGKAQARKSGKPLLVVLRCVP